MRSLNLLSATAKIMFLDLAVFQYAFSAHGRGIHPWVLLFLICAYPRSVLATFGESYPRSRAELKSLITLG